MPGLVIDTEGVIARIAQAKPESRRIRNKPLKSQCIFECLHQRRTFIRAYVHCPARVMLTESRCRIDCENAVNGLTFL